ncbi:uncharacterized protein QC763_0103520 [Podospora pseudopauciseta]|uniref:Uncharacterized protein n=1 Tax=Podospora pseudopauciseta TaxID=2093780 RepID=A0ABR0H0C9_9PEZI|nr:hypothetical protein QC763_0103520 [Podospora pseudopauciseta]
MDGRPPTEGPNQAKSAGASDARRTSDDPDKPDPELLALMRNSVRYLTLTESQDDDNNRNRPTGHESRSPPLPPQPEPTPTSTAAPTPSGTPGIASLLPQVRRFKAFMTQEEIDEHKTTAPTHIADFLPPPNNHPEDDNTPKSPHPTTPPGSGGISIPVSLSFRPIIKKLDAVEEQQSQEPKQEASTPAPHKRNKSHGDHIDTAIRTRLPDSASPKPRANSEGVSIPTPTRPPPPPLVEAQLRSSVGTMDTNKTPKKVVSPSFGRLMERELSSGGPSLTLAGPSSAAPSSAGARGARGTLIKDPSGRIFDIEFMREKWQNSAVAETKQAAAGVEKTLMGISETLKSIRLDHADEKDEKAKVQKANKGEEEEKKKKDDGDGKDDEKKLQGPKEKDGGGDATA